MFELLYLRALDLGKRRGLVVGIAPKYLFSATGEEDYEAYTVRVKERERKINRAFIEGMMGNCLVKTKTTSPWHVLGERKVFLDPISGAALDKRKNAFLR